MSVLEILFGALSSGNDERVNTAAKKCIASSVKWHCAYPIESMQSRQEVVNDFLLPLARALPDLERRVFIEIPGEYRQQHWLASTGYIVGTFSESLWGIPPTGRTLFLRFTELVRKEADQIAECYLIPDFLDAMYQAGVYPLRPSLGHPGQILPPATLDGICGADRDPAYSASTAQLIMDMLDCLRKYDGITLESMDLETFWHPDFLWYGPGGIGTTRGITGFRAHHQGPFLLGFPDRDVDHHACTVANGDYVATGGWPHMHATHTGGGWLGLPPSGKHLELRVMDIWRRQGDLLCENWVAIDIPHMLVQMGLDVFEQMRVMTKSGARPWQNLAD
ncbi:MAG: ester cyclase [Halioglobus sp.]